jgi:hypothetical protein
MTHAWREPATEAARGLSGSGSCFRRLRSRHAASSRATLRSSGITTSVRFYTKQKAVTSRWPTSIRAGGEFKMPTMG